MKKIIICGTLVVLMSLGLWIKTDGLPTRRQPVPTVYVPNEETAIKVAEAIFINIYGNKVLKQRPFRARLMDDEIWLVEGTLKGNHRVGGVATIEIQKSDCKVLTVYHTK